MLPQLTVALGALRGYGVGFDLRGPLGQQPEGFFDRTSQLFFNLAEVLFRMRKDHLQTLVHVLEPSLDLDLGQLGLREGGCLSSRGGFERGGIKDTFGQFVILGLGCGAGAGWLGFTAQGSADLPGRGEGGNRGESRGGHR